MKNIRKKRLAELDNKNQYEAKERSNNDKTLNTSEGNEELEETDYSTVRDQKEYNIYKNMINEDNLDDGLILRICQKQTK